MDQEPTQFKRLIDFHLNEWKQQTNPKPLVLVGQRQVGKTYTVRELGKTFQHFVELNVELLRRELLAFHKPRFNLKKLVAFMAAHLADRPLASTLLFLDEIQKSPETFAVLPEIQKAFPELHIIAATPSLDFAKKRVSKKITCFYMRPMSFVEFLAAHNRPKLVEHILGGAALPEAVHNELDTLLRTYMLIGGMPKAVSTWVTTKDERSIRRVYSSIINAYYFTMRAHERHSMFSYDVGLYQASYGSISRAWMHAPTDYPLYVQKIYTIVARQEALAYSGPTVKSYRKNLLPDYQPLQTSLHFIGINSELGKAVTNLVA